MPLQLKRFPEFGVELHIRRGAFSSQDLLEHFRSLGPEDALRWIYYYDETADASGIKLAHIPELKRIIAAKQKELFGDRPPASVVVCSSGDNRKFFDFWISFAGTGERHPTTPLLFPTLEAACESLGLPDAALEALQSAASHGDGGRRAGERNIAEKTTERSAAPSIFKSLSAFSPQNRDPLLRNAL